MHNKKDTGLLIAIEGPTGTGKTYFSKKLLSYLHSKHKLPVIKEGGFIDKDENSLPPITKLLQQMIKASRFIGLPWLCETTILLAEQAYNLEEYIMPEYNKGTIVLYENYNDALIAYQLMKGRETTIDQKKLANILNLIIDIQHDTFEYPIPDITIYIKSTLTTIKKRILLRGREELSDEDKESIRIIISNYDKLYKSNKNYLITVKNNMKTKLDNEVKEISGTISNLYRRKIVGC